MGCTKLSVKITPPYHVLGLFQQLFQFFQLPPFFPYFPFLGAHKKKIWKKKIVKMKINTHSLDPIKKNWVFLYHFEEF